MKAGSKYLETFFRNNEDEAIWMKSSNCNNVTERNRRNLIVNFIRFQLKFLVSTIKHQLRIFNIKKRKSLLHYTILARKHLVNILTSIQLDNISLFFFYPNGFEKSFSCLFKSHSTDLKLYCSFFVLFLYLWFTLWEYLSIYLSSGHNNKEAYASYSKTPMTHYPKWKWK